MKLNPSGIGSLCGSDNQTETIHAFPDPRHRRPVHARAWARARTTRARPPPPRPRRTTTTTPARARRRRPATGSSMAPATAPRRPPRPAPREPRPRSNSRSFRAIDRARAAQCAGLFMRFVRQSATGSLSRPPRSDRTAGTRPTGGRTRLSCPSSRRSLSFSVISRRHRCGGDRSHRRARALGLFRDRETRRRVAFSVAMIALSAKMAKADGVVSQREIRAFRRSSRSRRRKSATSSGSTIWRAATRRLRDLCRQDAGAVRRGPGNCALLGDVLDGLFHIAGADDTIHERELEFLARVAEIFGMTETEFERVKARHVQSRPGGGLRGPRRAADRPAGGDPAALSRARQGEPPRPAGRARRAGRVMAIATERMKAINAAWSLVGRSR